MKKFTLQKKNMKKFSSLITIFLVVISMALSSSICKAQNDPQDYVIPHNNSRQLVGAGGVFWNGTVAAYSQNYANQRKTDCQLIHSGGPYGENLFWGMGKVFNAADAVASWVAEKQWYDYLTNSCTAGKVCGHYTQVVWRSSTQIGCGRVACDSGAYFIICNYSPPGNFVGQWPY